MNREEAIKGLKVLAKDFSGYRPNEEMFNMAIEALEQPEPCEDTISRQMAIDAINHICPVDTEYDCTLLDRVDVRCVLSDLPSVQPVNKDINVPINDTISKQAAIDAIMNTDWYHQNKNKDMVHGANSSEHQAWYKAEDVYKALEQLPSAQPEVLACGSGELNAQSEQRWIPVTERLPEIDMSHPHHEDYLVQYDSGGVDVASWSNVNRFWTDHVTEPHWNCVQFATVIAWMPLPELYKGGEQNDDNGTDRIIEKA